MASATKYSLIVAALALVVSTSGCGGDEGVRLQVDERRGTVNGVGIGSLMGGKGGIAKIAIR